MINKLTTKTNVDYLYILVASILSALTGLLVIKGMRIKFKEDDFNNFVLMLRYAGTIIPLLIMGLGVATPRYIGFITSDDNRRKKIYSIINTSVAMIVVTIIFFLFVSWLLFDYIDKSMFGSESGYYYYAIIYFITMALYSFSNSILRGKELFRLTSLFEVIIRVIAPMLCLFLFTNTKDYILGVSFIAVITALSIVISNTSINKFQIEQAVLSFGARRVIGDMLYPLMITIPVLYVVYINGGDDAAKLSIGYMIVNVFLIPIRPISTLILPKVGRIFVYNNKARMEIKRLLLFSNFMASILLVIYLATARYVWDFFDYSVNRDYYIFSGILYCSVVYVICRSVLDGIFEKAYLFRFLSIALIVEVLSILIIHMFNTNYGYTIPLLLSNIVLITLIMKKLAGLM